MCMKKIFFLQIIFLILLTWNIHISFADNLEKPDLYITDFIVTQVNNLWIDSIKTVICNKWWYVNDKQWRLQIRLTDINWSKKYFSFIFQIELYKENCMDVIYTRNEIINSEIKTNDSALWIIWKIWGVGSSNWSVNINSLNNTINDADFLNNKSFITEYNSENIGTNILIDEMYSKIKNGLYNLTINSYLDDGSYNFYLDYYYDQTHPTEAADEYSVNIALDNAYNSFLSLQGYYNNWDLTNQNKFLMDIMYSHIKERLYSLVRNDYIDWLASDVKLRYYYTAIYDQNNILADIYKNDYLVFEKKMKDNMKAKFNKDNDTLYSKIKLPENLQNTLTKKINSIGSSKREQWIWNIIDKIDVILLKKSVSKKNKNTLILVKEWLQDYLENISSDDDVINDLINN